MKQETIGGSFDRTIKSLCTEIDSLQEEVVYWREKYEEERLSNSIMQNENLIVAKQGVANALMFALAVSDDKNGNLVISKKNRKELAKNYSK